MSATLAYPALVPTTFQETIRSLAQVRTLRELIGTLPATYQPSFGPFLEDLFNKSRRAAQALAHYNALSAHKKAGTLPAHLKSHKPTKLQVPQAYQGHANLREIQEEIEAKHKEHFAWVLEKEVAAHRGAYHLLMGQVSGTAWVERLETLCNAADRDLIAHLYFRIPRTHSRDANATADQPNPSNAAVRPRFVDVTDVPEGEGEAMALDAIPEPETISDESRRALLGELDVSGERITSALAEHWCRRAISLGKSAVDSSLAVKMRKLKIRDEAATAGPSKKPSTAAATTAAAPTTSPDTSALEKRFAAMEKAIKSLSQVKNGKPSPVNDSELTNNTLCRKRSREPFGEAEGFSKKRKSKGFPGRRKEERGSPEEGTWKGTREEREGVNTLRRCILDKEDVVPRSVLTVPFSSLVRVLGERNTGYDSVEPTPVFLCSGINIPSEIERVLSLNLKFIPHCDPTPEKIMLGYEAFAAKVRTRYHFSESTATIDPIILSKLYIPTGWQPEDRHFVIENALGKVKAYLTETLLKQAPHQRPRNPAFNAVSTWLKENQYIAKLTDKNLGVSVISAKWYHEKIMEHLATDTYSIVVDEWEINAIALIADKSCDNFKNPAIRAFLTRSAGKGSVPTFHGIPKVHKNPWKLRPIVPCHSAFITPYSKVLEAHLSCYLPSYPWIINSTRDFMRNLERAQILSRPDTWIVTADVENFYTNVDVVTATTRCEMIMKGHPDIKGLCTTEEVRFLMDFVNHSVFFKYQDITYHQAKGLAMGAPSSGIIANLFLAIEEKQWRLSNTFRKHIRMYNRYIDDIFMVFEGTKNELDLFLSEFQFSSLKLTFHVGTTHPIPFLDCEVKMARVEWDPLVTTLYAKPGNTHMYVPWSSAHPSSVKSAFVKAEMIRRKMICSLESDFQTANQAFINRLAERGYPRPFTLAIEEEINRTPRSLLLSDLGREDSQSEPLLIPSQYDKIWYDIKTSTIQKTFIEGLEEFGNIPDCFKDTRIIKSLRRNRNLKDFLDAVNLSILENAGAE